MAGVRGIDHVILSAPAELLERVRRFNVASPGAGDASAQDTDWLDRIAVACTELPAMRAQLDAASAPYRIDVLDMPPQVQVFLTAPAGVGVELNFRS